MDHVVAVVDPASLPPGVSFLEGGDVIVFKHSDGRILAAKNRCKHQGGRFPDQPGHPIQCSNHGWILDCSSMTYVSPAGDLEQEQLAVETTSDGRVRLLEAEAPRPWEREPMPREVLTDSEFTLVFHAHACMEITCGGVTLVTDPWLKGPAFSRGWWLEHTPSHDWPERVSAADAIYISHDHSDHMNRPTLEVLVARNPAVPIFVPDFEKEVCVTTLRMLGFTNVTALPFGVWSPLSDDARFMILPDSAGRLDSGLLVEYKGHLLLDTVDCGNLNGGILPADLDVLLQSFASGASGYPICWSELYSDEQIARYVDRDLGLARTKFVDDALLTNARVVVPFAGYAVAAHPADREIQARNRKNAPADMTRAMRRFDRGARVWEPRTGETFDVGALEVLRPADGVDRAPDPGFEPYLGVIRDAMEFGPLKSLEGVRRYFDWAAFEGDLVLHVIETTEDFAETIREFYVDFAEGTVSTSTPDYRPRYLRMRVRADVFRHVLREALPWEEISIGFQARFYREPDVYNFDFWDHFQNALPPHPPVWP